MPLINLKTDLKSLKFGKDRPGGGSSNQPYIKSKIPDQDSDQSSILNTGGPDSLLRGGVLAPIRAAEDTSRLTQMFADTKSPTGILFTAKQNLLSRLSVHTEASTGVGYGGKPGKVNQGIYTPLSTIGQAGVGITGTHLNTFGINPLTPMTGFEEGGLLPGLGLNRYESVVKELNEERDQSKSKNRLVRYLNTYIKEKGNLFFPKTPGGPGSILGIGKTKLPLSKQRTGINNETKSSKTLNPTDDFILPLGKTNYGELLGLSSLFPSTVLSDDISKGGGITWNNIKAQTIYEPGSLTPKSIKPSKKQITTSNFISPTGSINYEEKLGENNNLDTEISKDGGSWLNINTQKVYKPGSLDSDDIVTGTTTWTQQEIRNIKSEDINTKKITDFREKITAPTSKKVLGKLAGGYSNNFDIENRVFLGDPGKSKNVTKYGINIADKKALDKITASPILTNKILGNHVEYNDLCKFSIGIMNNDDTGTSNFMHFRAFIDGFDDSYTADWGNTQYVGRADKFYNYKGFDRNINLSFTVAAQSKAELIPMYKKLNYLASSLAPSYSQGGFMQGNLVRLTVGGYLYNQVGILKGITYTIPQESPWEIGISDEKGADDSSVKELPHIIKVSGFSFIPIQDFVPQVSPNPLNQSDNRFISLANGNSNNY